MADIGRWMNIDVLSEASRRFSPYTYAMDNPVFFIDVDGMFTDTLESQNIENCCPGFPFGRNSPKETSPLGKTMQNFTPSDKTMSLLSEGKELLTNVFGYEASATAGYGLGLEGRVGPIKAEGELTLAEAEVKTTDKNLIEAGIKAPGFKFNASLGEKKAELKGSLSTAKVEIDKNLNVKTSSEGATLKGTISKGDANLSLKNSGTLGLSIKLPSPDGISGKIGATINLYNAVIGVGKMIEGGASYLKDYVSNFFSGN